jgi:hypothetical protein
MIAELRLQIGLRTFGCHYGTATDGSNAVGRIFGWHRAAAQFNPELLAPLSFTGGLRVFLVRLKDAKPSPFRLGVQARKSLTEAERLIPTEP